MLKEKKLNIEEGERDYCLRIAQIEYAMPHTIRKKKIKLVSCEKLLEWRKELQIIYFLLLH